MAGELKQAAAVLPERIRRALLAMPAARQADVLEVRLYAASPVRLTTAHAALFLCADGSVHTAPSARSLCATDRETKKGISGGRKFRPKSSSGGRKITKTRSKFRPPVRPPRGKISST